MDPIKKFRIIFWVTFSLAALIIAGGVYYFINLDSWKEIIVSGKDSKISNLESELAQKIALLNNTNSQASTDKESLVAENDQLKKDKENLTTENNDLKSDKATALSYNDFFKHMNTVIETHNGFSGWTDAEFQTGKTLAEKTGNTAFVNTINWAWYETSVDPATRVIRVWKETQAGIENALK